MNFAKWIMMGGLALAATACGDKDNDGTPDVEEITQNVQLGPELHTNTWASKCRNFDWILGTYQQTAYDFDGIDFSHKVNFYSDENCQDLAGQIDFGGTFELHEVEGQDFNNINFDYDSANVEILSDKGVELAETANFCGRNEWEKNQRVEVTDAERGVNCPLFETPGAYYDIISLQEMENDKDRLYFGSGFLGPAAQSGERPTELNKDIEYRAE